MDIKQIAETMRTQNNRGTHLPIFIVVEDKKVYGVESGYQDGRERKDIDEMDSKNDLCESCADAYDKTGNLPEECDDCPDDSFISYRIEKDVPNMRAGFFFTSNACNTHIQYQSHHYNSTAKSYAISAYCNDELETVINFIKKQ